MLVLAEIPHLGKVLGIASDKGGALTRGEMTVQQAMTALGRSDITGVGCTAEDRADPGSAELAEVLTVFARLAGAGVIGLQAKATGSGAAAARTAAFTVLVLTQSFNGCNAHSASASAFRSACVLWFCAGHKPLWRLRTRR